MSTDYEIEADIVAAPSHKAAVLIEFCGEQEWIPRSLIAGGHDMDEGDEGEFRDIEIAEWKLEQLGWI